MIALSLPSLKRDKKKNYKNKKLTWEVLPHLSLVNTPSLYKRNGLTTSNATLTGRTSPTACFNSSSAPCKFICPQVLQIYRGHLHQREQREEVVRKALPVWYWQNLQVGQQHFLVWICNDHLLQRKDKLPRCQGHRCTWYIRRPAMAIHHCIQSCWKLQRSPRAAARRERYPCRMPVCKPLQELQWYCRR